MVGFLKGLLSLGINLPWKWIGLGAAALVLITASIAVVRSYNDAIETAQTEKQRADEWHRSAQSWKEAYNLTKGLREQEQRQAISSASRERNVCNQRVADALNTASRIREVVRVPARESNQVCPVGSVITSDELRDALGAN